MNLTNEDFNWSIDDQKEYKRYHVPPFELRKKIKWLMSNYEDGTYTNDQVLTIIKDLTEDQRKIIHDYIVHYLIDVFDPEEELLDLCDLLVPDL